MLRCIIVARTICPQYFSSEIDPIHHTIRGVDCRQCGNDFDIMIYISVNLLLARRDHDDDHDSNDGLDPSHVARRRRRELNVDEWIWRNKVFWFSTKRV